MSRSLDIARLSASYRTGAANPVEVIAEVYDRITANGDDGVWITVVPREAALARARTLDALPADKCAALPLFGLPFSVKDCIDVAGLPTTAACPAFAYVPAASSPVIAGLEAAGAILVGKTNLDQFATGIVGVRTPYGIARNPFDSAYIPGGSSSGAAVSVAAGLVSFAIGTDTGGSGRVPAAFNNVVGLKPTRGLLSLRGSVGTSRSLDCLSVFALTVRDATLVRQVAEGFDTDDPWSRRAQPVPLSTDGFRFAVPAAPQLDFLGDEDNHALFAEAVNTLEQLGGQAVEIDYSPFLAINDLLFQGPYLAERVASCGSFVVERADDLHPVTRTVLASASQYDAVQAFSALHRLQALRREAENALYGTEFLAVPTTPTIFTVAQIAEDPLGRNAALGRYTNFVNFLDMAALAVPIGQRPNGLPTGITLAGPAFADDGLATIGELVHQALKLPLGATGFATPHD